MSATEIVPLCPASIVFQGITYGCWLPKEHAGAHWRAQSHGFSLPLAWTGDAADTQELGA